TTDPTAPLYGQIDPDLSHPFRQKEVVREVNARLDGREVNAFDILSVRRIHEISEEAHPDFVHVPKFGSPQYSEAFVDWLVEQDATAPQFFARAKTRYVALRRRRSARVRRRLAASRSSNCVFSCPVATWCSGSGSRTLAS